MQAIFNTLFENLPHIRALLLVFLGIWLTGCASTGSNPSERFIDAFYSWDPQQLSPLLDQTPPAQRDQVLYYQAWAQAANYEIQTRRRCTLQDNGMMNCPITVTDDFGRTLGYTATDTFALEVRDDAIVAVAFSADDPPIFQALFEWIATNRPDVLAGPCLDLFNGGTTPAACARAVVDSARAFMSEMSERQPAADSVD